MSIWKLQKRNFFNFQYFSPDLPQPCTTTSTTVLQYNTIQYNTIQYNTIQYNTIQYNTKSIYYMRRFQKTQSAYRKL